MTKPQEQPTTQVTILDEPLAIKTEAPPEYTRSVAAHVDTTLRNLRRSVPTPESFPVAALGAMEITDELFRTRSGIAELSDDLVTRLERLTDELDTVLAEEFDSRKEAGTR
jgi:cell division protein ZapA (FtsZ GTPase activity inhibitor)